MSRSGKLKNSIIPLSTSASLTFKWNVYSKEANLKQRGSEGKLRAILFLDVFKLITKEPSPLVNPAIQKGSGIVVKR